MFLLSFPPLLSERHLLSEANGKKDSNNTNESKCNMSPRFIQLIRFVDHRKLNIKPFLPVDSSILIVWMNRFLVLGASGDTVNKEAKRRPHYKTSFKFIILFRYLELSTFLLLILIFSPFLPVDLSVLITWMSPFLI